MKSRRKGVGRGGIAWILKDCGEECGFDSKCSQKPLEGFRWRNDMIYLTFKPSVCCVQRWVVQAL